MKKYLTLALAICLSASSVFAASEFTKAFKDAVKSDVNAIKEAAKQDVTNQQKEAQKQKEQQNKEKKAAIEQKRKEQLKPVEAQIKDKETLIKNTNKDKSLTQTQKTLRTRTYQRQLDLLNAKKDSINKTYDAQLKALGF